MENKNWKPCQFDRDDYLAFAAQFEAVEIDDAENELCEFNEDINDMAFELAYTRYYLAKAERKITEYEQQAGEESR